MGTAIAIFGMGDAFSGVLASNAASLADNARALLEPMHSDEPPLPEAAASARDTLEDGDSGALSALDAMPSGEPGTQADDETLTLLLSLGC
jgi:hypothetical protein